LIPPQTKSALIFQRGSNIFILLPIPFFLKYGFWLAGISTGPGKRPSPYLHHDSEDYKVIIPHVTQEEHGQCLNQGCGDMAIPTRSIIKICPLEIK